jgi:kinesin family member 2/24
LRYSQEFAAEIVRYTNSHATPKAASTEEDPVSKPNLGVSVYCRKRPLFDHEKEAGDFDVVRVQQNGTSVTLFRTVMEADMKTKVIQPVEFPCTAAFGEKIASETVYRKVAQPMVQKVMEGGKATILMFGQTGSGKSYTMSALERLSFSQMFARNSLKDAVVQVQYLELCGKLCRDLIVASDNTTPIKLRDAADGSVRFVNAASISVDGAEQLLRVVEAAKDRRATQATDKNEVSSRSHALCQVSISFLDGRRGTLTLIDCAGTERKNDSMYHTKDRQSESTEINASLYALKEVLRARTSKSNNVHVPYRSSLLTRVLRESLENDEAQLAIIATIAPNATDFEHTLHTLTTVTSLIGTGAESGETQRVAPPVSNEKLPAAPKSWSHDELMQWMSDKRLIGKSVVSEAVNGRQVMRMSKVQLRNTFYEDNEAAKADRLFQLLRAESDRIGRLELKRRMAKGNSAGGSSTPIRW